MIYFLKKDVVHLASGGEGSSKLIWSNIHGKHLDKSHAEGSLYWSSSAQLMASTSRAETGNPVDEIEGQPNICYGQNKIVLFRFSYGNF